MTLVEPAHTAFYSDRQRGSISICLDENTIAAYMNRTLAEREAILVEQHLDVCPTCFSLVSQLANIAVSFEDIPTNSAINSSQMRFKTDWDETPASWHSSERFEPICELGSGGMGSVALVFDKVRNERVACKRILKPDPVQQYRFKLEFRAIEQMLHPNLVRLYEVGQDEQGMFFTMEAVDGWDLQTYCWSPSWPAFCHNY